MSFLLDKKKGPEGPLVWVFSGWDQLSGCKTRVPAFTKLCDLCAERQEKGKLPSCVFHCQAKCMEYGPVDELVKKLDEKSQQYLWVPPCA